MLAVTYVFSESWLLIGGHHNKYNNNAEVWDIVRSTKMWYMEWANVEKMALIDLLIAGLP